MEHIEHRLSHADWDGIRIFLAVARWGSFRKAAEDIGGSVNTIRRIVQRLEDEVGFALFYREAEGARLTPEGRRVVVAARDVERSMADMWRTAAASADTMKGPIRLAVTEGLGTFWLTPQLVNFIEESGGQNRIELQCAMRSVDVLRLEADISIQLEEPRNPDLIVRRLGFLHMVPFASKAYLERHGRPATMYDIASHRVVEQVTDQLRSYDIDKVFGPGAEDRMVKFRTNFSSAHYWAIAKGAGIGLMPNYAPMIGAQVEHVDIGWVFRVTIWMASHPEVLKTPRHRNFADWLVRCFDNRRYPWFGEEYLTPAQIRADFKTLELADYFSGFTAGSAA